MHGDYNEHNGLEVTGSVVDHGPALMVSPALAAQPESDPIGNVGIGTASPQYKQAVNGTIGAKKVIVTNTGWSDYVFRPGYRLRPLSEVGAYIHQHHRT